MKTSLKEIGENKNIKEVIEYLQDKKILHKTRKCRYCDDMAITDRPDVEDQFRWRCSKCRQSIALRKDTFLEKIRLSFQLVLQLIYHWGLQTVQDDQSKTLKLTRPTIISFQQKLRLVTARALRKSEIILGGPGKVVEIDESLFVKVKHHKGKDLRRPQVWVFGMYERSVEAKKRCLFITVPKRDSHTLLNVIYKHIAPETTILSDCWSSYRRIKDLPDRQYQHKTVNHDLHFVDPVTLTHTNSIESVWNSAKMHLKSMRGNFLHIYY